MTPQEKAKELVGKYQDVQHEKSVEYEDETCVFEYGLPLNIAKQCALIAVEEIMSEVRNNCDITQEYTERLLFWQQVEQEIEKL